MIDNILYEWLLSNEKTDLLDYILILSSNGLMISQKELINFCKTPQETDNLNGLNNNQFQILKNSLTKSQTNKQLQQYQQQQHQQLIYKHKENTKFDWVLKIINENNKNNSKQQINNQSLFQKVWGNIVIRREIIYHLRLFNIHLGKNMDYAVNKLISNKKEYQYKHYWDVITLKTAWWDIREEEEISSIKPGIIPNSVRTVTVENGFKSTFQLNSLPSSITSIKFYSLNQPIIKELLPSSITSLEISYSGFNRSLGGNWLPPNLKLLNISSLDFDQSIFKSDQLPKSLTQLILCSTYKGTIEPDSIPKSVQNLKFLFNSNQNIKKLLPNDGFIPIPYSTTKLEFDHYFNQKILIGSIPKNVNSLSFSSSFNSSIQNGSFPILLKELIFSGKYSIVDYFLPNGLTSLELYFYDNKIPLTSNMFPLSITSIKISESFNQVIPDGYFLNHVNLTSLDLGKDFTKPITPNTLPPNLISLTLDGYYEKYLKSNIFPSSITSLSLKTWCGYISKNSLPCNLKVLYLKNPNFSKPICDVTLIPSLEPIYLNSHNTLYLKTIDIDFNKYIRFK